MAFSRAGLIDQLKFEGYSKTDAAAAVDSLTVDWQEQAALKAESYLDTGSFSESGLIDQLEFEGFTRAQAEFGAQSVFGGGGVNDDNSNSGGDGVSLQNAIEAAENYLRVAPFSESGLIDQLAYEGYSNSDARAAVGSLRVDWNEQAANAAQNYLDLMPFSRSELIDQLEFEGYTSSQAAYGASRAGL
jgi:colicin import membrane protein